MRASTVSDKTPRILALLGLLALHATRSLAELDTSLTGHTAPSPPPRSTLSPDHPKYKLIHEILAKPAFQSLEGDKDLTPEQLTRLLSSYDESHLMPTDWTTRALTHPQEFTVVTSFPISTAEGAKYFAEP